MKWVYAALSGFLLSLCFPPQALHWLAWVALAPLFHAVLNSKDAHQAANLGAVTGLIFYYLSLSWLSKIFGPWVSFAFFCLFALWIALHAALLRALRDRLSPLPLAAVGALLWVGPEYFRSEVWKLNNSWMALGYSQVPNLQILQSAGIWGVYGISALLAYFNLACAQAWGGDPKSLRRAAVLALACALWGAWVLCSPDQGREVKVALVQDESLALERLGRLSAGAGEAQLLVWPEYAVQVEKGREEQHRKAAVRALKGSRAVAVIGAHYHPEDPPGTAEDYRNFAWVLAPGGALLGEYDKLHPIPYVERLLRPNPDPRPVDTPLGRLGIQICYDLDFEDGTRLLAAQGAEILAVPNMDPLEWGPKQHLQHSAMAPLRAVESGLWIARAASSGVSQVIDPRGRVRASLETGQSGLLAGTARMQASRTPYTRGGWLLGPLCLALSLAAMAWAAWLSFRRRKKS